jgi:hypothetical protein
MTKMLSDYNIWDTEQLLGRVLTEVLADERIMFLAPRGKGGNVVAKTRVMLSRTRQRLKAKNKPLRRFTLHSSVHQYTDSIGKTQDCIVMWASRTENHQLSELLEDLLRRDQ